MEAYGTEIGLIGVALVALTYGLYASGKIKSTDWSYPILNITGTTCILISVLYQWNLPSFVAQIAWIILSLVGMARIVWSKRRG